MLVILYLTVRYHTNLFFYILMSDYPTRERELTFTTRSFHYLFFGLLVLEQMLYTISPYISPTYYIHTDPNSHIFTHNIAALPPYQLSDLREQIQFRLAFLE